MPSLLFCLCFCLLCLSLSVQGDTSSDGDGINFEIVLIKIGGSSITHKSEFESLNDEALSWFARIVSESTTSKHYLSNGETTCPQGGRDDNEPKKRGFVIVHGAGSFGHFTAKEFGLKGQSIAPIVPPSIASSPEVEQMRHRQKEGLVKTRISVQKLNYIVVQEFIQHGMNAVGVSPCFGVPGLQAHANLQREAQTHLQTAVLEAVQAGLIPVLHGDACLHGKDGAGILSGDTLMEILGVQPWIHHAVFITDVDGVFDKDPRSDPDAQLLHQIAVNSTTGDIVADVAASGSSHEHDVTGGLKVSSGKT